METLRCPRCETMATSALCPSCGTQIDAFHLRRARWALAGAAAAICVGTFVGWLSFDSTHVIPAKVSAMHGVLEASGVLGITLIALAISGRRRPVAASWRAALAIGLIAIPSLVVFFVSSLWLADIEPLLMAWIAAIACVYFAVGQSRLGQRAASEVPAGG